MSISYIPLKVDEKRALKVINSERKGILKKERVGNVSLIWIPVTIVKIKYSYREKLIQDKIIKEENWNVYELLKGWWTGLSFSHKPKLESGDSFDNLKGSVLKPRIKAEDVANFVNNLKYVKSPVKLTSYGVPANSIDVEVIEHHEAYYPFYIGILLSSKMEKRLISISGFSGYRCPVIEKLVEDLIEGLKK